MIRPAAPLAAALALLAGAAGAAPSAAPAAPEEALPGIDLSALSPAQRETAAAVARDAFCYCGCPHTVSACLREHKGCRHAPRMARLAARYAALGAKKEDVAKLLDEYYASFDRRARIDTAAFGPPFGDPGAPITLVEYSDFACPYCRALRPVLERFVEAHAGRVKLVYKPFPIDAHPGAFDAAQAAEWARGQGIFWKYYETLFAHPHDLGVDDLVSYAKELGADGAALRKALEDRSFAARVSASREEARTAGLRGTPTLFFDGRRLVLPDMNDPAVLELTLEDEEEWRAHRGWRHD
jgi:protein-disulfide isomerase